MNSCRTCVATLFAFVFSFAVSGCSSAYVQSQSVTAASDYPAAIKRAQKDRRSLILHSGINVYTITALQLDKAKQNIHVQLNKVDSSQVVRVTNPDNQQPGAAQSQSLPGELHVYLKDSVSYLLEEPHTIPLQKVERMEVVGKG